MKLVVMIPAYNEEKSIGSVIKEIPRKILGMNVEVLVINDGCSDNTAAEAKKAGADMIVSHNGNKGLGVAFKTGLDSALEMGADIIVNTDADGQFNPKDIEKLLQPILEKKADMVTCSRFLNKEFEYKMPWIKKFGNKLFTKTVSLLTGQDFTDTQCGFRAYSREAAMRLNLFGRFTYTQEAFIDLSLKNMRIMEVPLKVKYDNNRKSRIVKKWYLYGLNSLAIITRIIRDYKPLKFFGIIGVSIFSLGIISGGYLLYYWLQTGMISPHIPLTILTAILLIVGFQLMILALMADMMGRQRKIEEEILYYNKKQVYNHVGK